jgi:hypothetical protein
MASDKGKWTGWDGAERSAHTENAGVASSILALGTTRSPAFTPINDHGLVLSENVHEPDIAGNVRRPRVWLHYSRR